MRGGNVIILGGGEIQSLLEGREREIIEAVRRAYEAHARGNSSLPHSTFLRFPDNDRNRIIALPAYLGPESAVAGVKWVSSFPGNHDLGLDRASAVVILNSAVTGRTEAILEGATISAKRTAASAALAASHLAREEDAKAVGLVGCGVINFEVARFLFSVFPRIERLVLMDLDKERARRFGERCRRELRSVEIEVARDVQTVLGRCRLTSLATTGLTPYIDDLGACSAGSTILHISLRDLTPEVILSCENIVDDVDHVCRANTSVHLAEQLTGGRTFIRGTLADVTLGLIPARRDAEAVTVFSPFGLGVLDLAVGKLALDLGRGQRMGTVLESFQPESLSEN